MRYLAIAEKTATWLIDKPTLLDALAHTVLGPDVQALAHGDLELIPVRVRSAQDVVVFMHVDHRSPLNDEHLGFVELRRPSGAEGADEAFRRCMLVVSRRLRNKTLHPEYQHRRMDAKVHCMPTAPRSALLLSWVERTIQVGSAGARTLLISAPSRDALPPAAADALLHELRRLSQMTRHVMMARPGNILPETALPALRSAIRYSAGTAPQANWLSIMALARPPNVSPEDMRRAERWTYDQWSDSRSTLSDEQRVLLEGDAILDHPVRVFGPAGSGKTLLMQLMAIRRLRATPAVSVLYVTHNVAMEDRVRARFAVLLNGREENVRVTTLSAYAKERLRLTVTHEFEDEPERARAAAFEWLRDAIDDVLADNGVLIARSATLQQLTDPIGRRYFDEYVRAEISSVIKGRGQAALDREDYTHAETALSAFHGVLTPLERGIVYDIFERYQGTLQAYGVMDPDDVAIELLMHLGTPRWKLDRLADGFDYVFVDEAQLFNDNERLIFGLLTSGRAAHTPVVIALDDMQRLYAPAPGGLGLFGLSDVERMTLRFGHRMTEEIARLALFILSESREFYDEDLPDFSGVTMGEHELLGGRRVPQLWTVEPERTSDSILRIVGRLRDEGLTQFAVIAHSPQAMAVLSEALGPAAEDRGLVFSILRERGGERDVSITSMVLSRPELIGGQEFDCVFCCGLEEGVVPPTVHNNPVLARTYEQQAYREIYLAVTRARHQLFFINAKGSRPTQILQRAARLGRIEILNEEP